MKKVINDPLQVVPDMFKGMSIAHPELECDLETGTVFRRNKPANKVAVITGGGSGHEPAHGGYVGEGMLDAAVAGNVFASPSADKIYKAMLKISAGRGIVQIIKNYSGDVMNFGMAKDLAELDGIRVEQIIVKDDVATVDDDYTSGRRGIAGTVFIHKIVGAAAESGKDLDEVVRIGRRAVEGMRSVGFALTPCSLPAADSANFRLGDEEFEFGLGIHGEPGLVAGIELLDNAAQIAALVIAIQKAGRLMEHQVAAGVHAAGVARLENDRARGGREPVIDGGDVGGQGFQAVIYRDAAVQVAADAVDVDSDVCLALEAVQVAEKLIEHNEIPADGLARPTVDWASIDDLAVHVYLGVVLADIEDVIGFDDFRWH